MQELDLCRNPNLTCPIFLSYATRLERLALLFNVVAGSAEQLAALEHLRVLLMETLHYPTPQPSAHAMRTLLETVANLPRLERLDLKFVISTFFDGALGALVALAQRTFACRLNEDVRPAVRQAVPRFY